MSSTLEDLHAQHVLFRVEQKCGFITLNRPRALNALSVQMMTAILQQLVTWSQDQDIEIVIVESQSAHSFCSGGDLRSVYAAIKSGHFDFLDHLFRHEYSLNYLIHEYPKPYLAFIDGVVMGGGIGLSVHGDFRIVGEHVTAAMPETNLGFFPDVGASLFLNQCPGKLGLYLGLTGVHLNLADTLYSRIGTHYVPSHRHKDLKYELMNLPNKNLAHIKDLIESYHEPFSIKGKLENNQSEIDRCFKGTMIEEICSNLSQSKSSFCNETLEHLKKRSPTSLKVTLEQLRRGATLTLADAIKMEFELSQKFVQGHDFFEGIRAAIIDKDKTPHWQPADLSRVTNDMVAHYFDISSLPLDLNQIINSMRSLP